MTLEGYKKLMAEAEKLEGAEKEAALAKCKAYEQSVASAKAG